MEKATFGAGCFWGVEAAFMKVKGVSSTEVGFMGGSTERPSYEQVCTGKTGHTEVVQLGFDPKKVSFEELLEVFWRIHDPTTMDRQGPDIGRQYRSVVFYHSERQKKIAEKKKGELDKSGKFPKPIVTAIEPAKEFYRAEEYHQKYYEKHGQASCHV